MPARNAQILILATLVCLLCYMQAKRLKYAGRIGAAIETIEQYYVDEVKGDDLYQSAMKGMLKLDPYSEFIPPVEYTEFQSTIDQQFGGVGILIEGPPTNRELTVVAPLLNTPAYEAGVQPGDRIVSINGQSTKDFDTSKASEQMRGPVGTTVDITIERDNQMAPIELTLRRADIQVDSIVGDHILPDSKWSYFLKEDPEIAYVRISLFGKHTADEFRQVLKQIKPQAKALIIDLRFNPGGVLSAAVDMCDMLLSQGRIVSTKGRRSGFDHTETADASVEIAEDIPIIVLQNDQSASASEVMAACLQDQHRALVAGERSFGKGTVQQVFEIDHASTAIKFTIARYYRPSGANIHRTPEMKPSEVWGVSPEKELEQSLSDSERLYLFRRWQQQGDPRRNTGAQPPAPDFSGDPQLRKAVEYLNSPRALPAEGR